MTGVDVEFAGPLTWNVAFERGRTIFGHVLAFAPVGGCWLVIDPHLTWTETHVLTADEFDHWILGLSAIAVILRIPGGRSASPLAGLFCVGKVKHLIGFRSGALSPAGLKRDLLKAGAKQVFLRESQNSQGRPDDQVGP